MAEKITVILYDRDGSPSVGYPCKVALSRNRDTLDPVGQVGDAVTGYYSSEITVYTDGAGRACIEIEPFLASDCSVSNDFATSFTDGTAGSGEYEMPFDPNVALYDVSNEYRPLADILGQETIPVQKTDAGFAIFPLPNGEYPYPQTISCTDEDDKRYSCISLHPDRRPGVDFYSSSILPNTFLYSLDDNAIYIPDIKVTSITVDYHIRPFYVLKGSPRELRIYNRQTEVNIVPQKSISQQLNNAIINGGLIVSDETPPVVSVQSNETGGPVFRDIKGVAITGNIMFFPDVVLYLWVEYPNILGEPAPMRRVKEVLMPNPLHKVQQAINFVRG